MVIFNFNELVGFLNEHDISLSELSGVSGIPIRYLKMMIGSGISVVSKSTAIRIDESINEIMNSRNSKNDVEVEEDVAELDLSDFFSLFGTEGKLNGEVKDNTSKTELLNEIKRLKLENEKLRAVNNDLKSCYSSMEKSFVSLKSDYDIVKDKLNKINKILACN